VALAPIPVLGRAQYVELPQVVVARTWATRAFLLLAAVVPSGIVIHPPTAQMTIAGLPPSSYSSSTAVLYTRPPTYADQPPQVVQGIVKRTGSFLLASPPPGAKINVGTLAMTLTAYAPVSGYMQFILYQPSDDGWWEEAPEQDNSKLALRAAFLAAPTNANAVVINVSPRQDMFLTAYVPNVVASGQSITVNVPEGTLTLTGFAPAQPFQNITLQMPVAQLGLTAFPPNQIFFAPPTGLLRLAGYPPFVINSGQVSAPGAAPANLGYKVTFRNFSLEEMAARAWGSEFNAPDHDVYRWSNNRSFDSTDMGTTGIYKKPS